MSIKQTQMGFELRDEDHGVYFDANDDSAVVHVLISGASSPLPLERIKWLREALFEIALEQGYDY